MSYGMDARIGISFQNSYGTANVASMHWLEPINESVDLKKAQQIQKGLRGIYDEGQPLEGMNTVAGDVLIEAKGNDLGVLLAAVCGNPTSVTSGALYTHTFKPRTTDHSAPSAERPFTYHKFMGDTGSAHQYSDLNGNSLELAIANGEFLTAKLSVVGGSYARSAAIAAVHSVSNPIDWAVSSVSLGGAGVTNIKLLTISQNNNLAAQHTVGSSGFPSRVKRTDMRTIDIAGTMFFDDQAETTKFLSQTGQAVKIFMKGTSLVQSGFYESLLVDIPTMRYTEHPLVVGGAGQQEVSFKAKAIYNVGSATSIAYTLQCGKAGY